MTACKAMRFGCAALMMLALALSLAFAGVESAHAASTTLSIGTAATSSSTSSTKTTTSTKKSTKKKKKGNLDKYIGLKKSQWVIATGKTGVPIYRKAKASSRTISSFQAKSCIVIDTSKMKAGKKYRWLKVKLKGKRRGYIRLSAVKLRILDTRTFGLDFSKKKNRLRAAICRWGLKWLGTPYAHAYSLKYGLHCGAFAKKCFTRKGFKFTSASVDYLGTRGKAVPRKNLKPADMVFYSHGSIRYHHVAVYIGKGLIMNSSGIFGTIYPRGGVRISTLDYRSPSPFAFRNVVGN